MNAGFCITPCIASIAAAGSRPGGIPIGPAAAAPPAPPSMPGMPPFAIALCMFSAIVLNEGSSAICFAMSLMAGSSSISFILLMSKGAPPGPPAPAIICASPGGIPPAPGPPGIPNPSGISPAILVDDVSMSFDERGGGARFGSVPSRRGE
eukprot:31554-Pelagococcus_subviridis.AAC.3